MKSKRKKLRRYNYNFGGFLKDIAPVAVAAGVSAIPGVGPAVAPLAAQATQAGITAAEGSDRTKAPPRYVPYSPSSTGYKYGGKMKYANGGAMPVTQPLPGGAKKYNGPKHEQGGIPIDGQGNATSESQSVAEVEGGETEQDGYIFSDSLTVPGTKVTFAEAHERMVNNGADKQQIMKLRQLQEREQKRQGVKGGDEMKDGGSIHIKESKKGTFTKAAKKRGMGVQEFASKVLNNKEKYSTAMVKKANFAKNASKWNKKHGGSYQYGGGLLATGTNMAMQTQQNGMFDQEQGMSGFDKGMEVAGYVVPSLTRGAMALTSPDVKDTPKVRAGRVPVQSSVFSDAKRKMAGDYRAILDDPNATRNQKLAAQAQLQQGRSQVAGKEADYRGRMQQFNAQAGQKADAINAQNFQRDREVKAQESAAKQKMLTQAVEMPITAYNTNKRGKESQIANVMISANRIQDPVDRRQTIQNSLRGIGLSDAEIAKIMRKYNV